MERKLNLDIPQSVSEFEMLIKRVLPRNILYRLTRGKGLEFDSYRSFSSNDDDASMIDWRASLRANELLVKQYIEERELKIIIAIDVSDNMIFGSTEKLKCEYAAEIGASLAHLMLLNGDNIGFVLFSNKIVKLLLPRGGMKQFEIFVNELSNPLNYGGYPNFANVLDDLLKLLSKDTSLVVLISDFLGMKKDSFKYLEGISARFETVALSIKDPLDLSLPEINKEIIIQNPSNGEKLLINPKLSKKIYEQNAKKQIGFINKMFYDANVDFVQLNTSEKFYFKLVDFLKLRIERKGRFIKNVS